MTHPDPSPVEILVVDDSLDTLRFLSQTLTRHGYDVRSVTTGQLAIASVAAALPDLILLDINLPDRQGYDVCQQLKANPPTQAVPIIFISALDDPIDKVTAFKVGGMDYITKPFQIEEVLTRIAHHLALKHAQDQIQQFNTVLEQRVLSRTAQLEAANQALHREIAERQLISTQLQASEEKFRQFAENIQDVFWLVEWSSPHPDEIKMIYVSPAVESLWQRTCADVYARPWGWVESIHPDDRDRVATAFLAMVSQGEFDEEYRIVRPDGSICWVHDRGFPVPDATGKIYRIAGITKNITERKQTEDQLRYEAHHDLLTGLKNRSYFMAQLEQTLKHSQDLITLKFATLFIDLDRFKLINDTLGHQIGDMLLQQVAQILSQHLRKRDMVARIGGDEFTILLTHLPTAQAAIDLAERIQRALQAPLMVNGHQVYTSASIGIVVGHPRYTNANDILRDADIAMYRAKDQGKACYELFDQSMYEHTLKQVQLETQLRQAIAHQDLEVYYQPIWDIRPKTPQIKGFEALLRWQNAAQDWISPQAFIPVAEDTGLINSLGIWVLEQACEQLSRWQSCTNNPALSMSVNVSSAQLRDRQLLDALDRVLNQTAINPAQLILELTESSLIENVDTVNSLLQAIEQRGIQIGLDDFGTGFSSLSYLHRFPIHLLKIDQSFVRAIQPNQGDRSIIHAIAQLAQNLGIIAVAEGIETPYQLTQVQHLGCDYGQGYLLARPLTAAQAEALLSDFTPMLYPCSSEPCSSFPPWHWSYSA